MSRKSKYLNIKAVDQRNQEISDKLPESVDQVGQYSTNIQIGNNQDSIFNDNTVQQRRNSMEQVQDHYNDDQQYTGRQTKSKRVLELKNKYKHQRQSSVVSQHSQFSQNINEAIKSVQETQQIQNMDPFVQQAQESKHHSAINQPAFQIFDQSVESPDHLTKNKDEFLDQMESDTSMIESFLIQSNKKGGHQSRLNFESIDSLHQSRTIEPTIGSNTARSMAYGPVLVKNDRNRLYKRPISNKKQFPQFRNSLLTPPLTTFSVEMRNKVPRFMMETKASNQTKKIRLSTRFNVQDREREHSENEKNHIRATWSKLSTARLRPYDRDLEQEVAYDSYERPEQKKKLKKDVNSFVSKLHQDARIKDTKRNIQKKRNEEEEKQQIQSSIKARRIKVDNYMSEQGMQSQKPVYDRVQQIIEERKLKIDKAIQKHGQTKWKQQQDEEKEMTFKPKISKGNAQKPRYQNGDLYEREKKAKAKKEELMSAIHAKIQSQLQKQLTFQPDVSKGKKKSQKNNYTSRNYLDQMGSSLSPKNYDLVSGSLLNRAKLGSHTKSILNNKPSIDNLNNKNPKSITKKAPKPITSKQIEHKLKQYEIKKEAHQKAIIAYRDHEHTFKPKIQPRKQIPDPQYYHKSISSFDKISQQNMKNLAYIQKSISGSARRQNNLSVNSERKNSMMNNLYNSQTSIQSCNGYSDGKRDNLNTFQEYISKNPYGTSRDAKQEQSNNLDLFNEGK